MPLPLRGLQEILDLSDNGVTDLGAQSLKVLAGSPRLNHLYLSHNLIGTLGAAAIASLLPTLVRAPTGNPAGEGCLAGHRWIAASPPDSPALCSVQPSLKSLNLSFNSIIGDEGAEYIAKCVAGAALRWLADVKVTGPVRSIQRAPNPAVTSREPAPLASSQDEKRASAEAKARAFEVKPTYGSTIGSAGSSASRPGTTTGMVKLLLP